MTADLLPVTAKEVFRLGPKNWLIYNGVIAFNRLTGKWRYPAEMSGDLETMKRIDLIYWVYKTIYPMYRARKGSGLEAFFAMQEGFKYELPSGFIPSAEVTLSSVGDLMNHPFLGNSVDTLYADVAEEIFSADLPMANVECVVYPKATGTLNFSPKNGPPLFYNEEEFRVAKGFRGRDFAFVTVANNHSLDFGQEGAASTMRELRGAGIAFNGLSESEKASYEMCLLERRGVKFGIASHTFGLNAYRAPESMPWIVNRTLLNGKVGEIDLSRIEKQLAHGRSNGIDVAVAQLHWGMEHEFYPTPNQVELAHHLAELGFDVIIGHHPHVVQPIEYYRTKRDADRVVPIYYSLGNLINPFSAPYVCRSYVARLTVAKGRTRAGEVRTYVKTAGKTEVVQEADARNRKLRLR